MILASEACLISNRAQLLASLEKMERARALVDFIEGRMRSEDYYSITANMRGESPEEVAQYVLRHPEISGLTGPTVSKVYPKDNSQGWYAVTVVVEKGKLLAAVDHLRELGGGSVTVSQPNYVFQNTCKAHSRLV
jgi:ATP phosphoribosyltransferase